MKSLFNRFLIPALISSTPSFVLTFYNLTHIDQLQTAAIFRYFGLINMGLSLLILLFFAGRYRKFSSVDGNVTFKMIFSYTYRIVFFSAICGFFISFLFSYIFKEETKELGKIATEMQVKELINKKGSITETDKHDLESSTQEKLNNPLSSSFSYSLSILFFGIFHCLIVSIFWILFGSFPAEIKT